MLQSVIVALERRIPLVLRRDLDTRRRALLALGIAVLVAIGCTVIAVLIALFAPPENRGIGVVNTVSTAVLAGVTLPLLQRRGLKWAGNWLAALIFAGTVFALVQSGGAMSLFALDLPILITMVTMISGRRSGFFWAIAGIVALVIIHLVMSPEVLLASVAQGDHPTRFAVVVVAVLVVVQAVLIALSETTKREAIAQIAEASRRVDAMVLEEQRTRLAADQAIAANAAKSAFLATMSHELRTPLSIILGYTEIVLEELEDHHNPQVLGDLRRVHGAGLHLLGLISDVLDLSRIETDQFLLLRDDFDVTSLLDDLVRSCQPLVSADVRLTASLPATLPVTGLDRLRLRQLVLNLVTNALKFTERGQVVVTAQQDGSEVTIMVEDTGIGIAADHLELIFTPFTQVDASPTRRRDGAGLGLAIARKLSERMAGTLHVQSKLGQGSRFTVRVPATGPPSDPAPPQQ